MSGWLMEATKCTIKQP